jgi:hypothetical protein
VQNGESIGVRLDESSNFQIILGDLRQLSMPTGGIAAAGKWEI